MKLSLSTNTVLIANLAFLSTASAATTYAYAVIGDWPYSLTLLKDSQTLVNSINSDVDVKTLVHVGDIHSGSMPCTGAGLTYSNNAGGGNGLVTGNGTVFSGVIKTDPHFNIHVYNAFQKFKAPVVYTPGDNEWADCHKTKQFSSGAPLAELASVRELFFAKPGWTLGGAKMVTSQGTAFNKLYPDDAQFVENVIWADKVPDLVLFATFNMPGGSNNDADSWTAPFTDNDAQLKERNARTNANLRWLDRAFNVAVGIQAKAVVILLQADMWDTEKYEPATYNSTLSNYQSFVLKLAQRSLAFNKPVLLINGDSHNYKVDRPLVTTTVPYVKGCSSNTTTTGPGCNLAGIHNTPQVPKLTRIVVEGSGVGQHWLKLTIDTSLAEENIFSWVNVPY